MYHFLAAIEVVTYTLFWLNWFLNDGLLSPKSSETGLFFFGHDSCCIPKAIASSSGSGFISLQISF